jgi:hypothetical protein
VRNEGLGASATRSPNGEEGTRGAGDINERKLNSLISGFEFPDKPLIIPCSIPSQDLALAAEVTQIEAFTAANGRNEPIEFTKFPVFFPVSREFRGGEGFARDCILRQQVSTAEKPCDFPLKIAENPRNSACFALKPDSEKVSCWTQKASSADLLSGGLTGSPVSRLPSGECNAIRNRSFCECDLTSVSNDVHRKDLASAE